uniref:THAP-type domain-containing protein n=1 Tax=Cyprinus carpio TaxID=7962 RepID=A0A8C1NFV7_CYPCA
MANRGGSGKFCAAKGCHNSYRKLKKFLDQECNEHKPTIRAECKCPRPFKLHKMPSDDVCKRQWLAALNLKCPPRPVCSFHFVDRQPTTENPYPELWLGYDRPLKSLASAPSPKQTDVDDSSCTSNIFPSSMQCDPFKPPTLMNDYDSNLYTGLPLHTFHTLVAVLHPHENLVYQTEIEQQILLTLMKLKLNLLIEDLAIRFRISVRQVSRIISFRIDTMAAYKQHYPNVTCILDCSESEYLVAIATCGLVMFISAAYGGCCSDKFITCDSGILEYLQPGDEVMVDRVFLIRDLFERQVNMIIPHFANKMQLTEEKVTCSRRIANVRIHVERAIRRLKVYKVLSQTLPITLMPKIDIYKTQKMIYFG